MQVGNIYVDLEIPELELKDFLEPEDCFALEIVETAGTSLPTALMVIKARDEKVINSINENNYVEVLRQLQGEVIVSDLSELKTIKTEFIVFKDNYSNSDNFCRAASAAA